MAIGVGLAVAALATAAVVGGPSVSSALSGFVSWTGLPGLFQSLGGSLGGGGSGGFSLGL